MDGVFQPDTISGSLVAIFLYNVCDEIRLDSLRSILKASPAGREPPFRQRAPEYVKFAQPPLVEQTAPAILPDGVRASGQIAYFEYGVVSVRLDLPFSGGWSEVASLVSRWMEAGDLERQAERLAEIHIQRAATAIIGQYSERLTEDYYVILLPLLDDERQTPILAARLIEEYGAYIAQIVRGETAAFSSAEMQEILESRVSYYETDLLVVGWTAAFLYDTPSGAIPTLQLLEYANSQLLEFRHYDAILTRLLSQVNRQLVRGTGFLARWRLAREAERLNLIRLEIRELTERVDNSIKFLSDMFAARLYRMAASKIGVPDYRVLVEQKLQSARDLYSFMMDRFYQGRAFVLEVMVVVILIIELIFLFRGKG